jgi:hypothetical protein
LVCQNTSNRLEGRRILDEKELHRTRYGWPS